MKIMSTKRGRYQRFASQSKAPKSDAADKAREKWRKFFEKRSEMLDSITDEKLKASAAKN
ncbi:MAG: hypothetical protein AAGH74_02320 [Pseudomonadota bacterium]